MDLHDDNAASKTLPLGTKARVTNLDTGKSPGVGVGDLAALSALGWKLQNITTD